MTTNGTNGTAAAARPNVETILLAALDLENVGERPFSFEALAVASWKRAPHAFGLKAFTEYPDSNKVKTYVVGARGLVRRGLFGQVGPQLYMLTPYGRGQAQRLAGVAPPDAAPPRNIRGEKAETLLRLLGSTAAACHREGRKTDITFREACAFWNLSEYDCGETVTRRLEAVVTSLQGAEKVLHGGSEAVLPGGRVVTGEDVDALFRCHDYLEARFARHLGLLRGRKEGPLRTLPQGV